VPDAGGPNPAVLLLCGHVGAALATEHGGALVFDPRGVGAVRNRELHTTYIPWNRESYLDVYGTEFKLVSDAILLGTPLFGMRVFDVRRAVEFLRSALGTDRVALVREGVSADHALYAAVADESVDAVSLHDLGPSFETLATTREHDFDPGLTLFDVVGDCYVPHLLAALDDRELADVQVERAPAGHPGDD
jgi:hypothetical protein